MFEDLILLTSKFRKYAHWIGHIIGILCVGFIAFKLSSNLDFVSLSGLFSPFLMITIILLASVYAINLTFLAYGWHQLILAEEGLVSIKDSLYIYGKSQIAKYLPGNIFHLVGRQWLGHVYGLSQTMLVKSSLWEIGLIAISAVIVGLTTLANVFTTFSAMILLMLIMVVAIAYVLTEFFKTGYVKAFYAYLIFHIIAGFLFAVLLNLIAGNVFNNPASLAICISAYVLAWLVGFVTPGVPGGAGVREMVILLLLGQGYPERTLLVALVAGRIVTTLGDLILYLMVSFKKFSNQNSLKPKQSIQNAP